MGWIYCFTFPNGKKYVGKTKKEDVRKRWHLHRVRDNHCWLLARAIRKYGWVNIQKRVLAKTPEDNLDALERMYIESFNCVKPNGYNLTPGGDFNPMDCPEGRQRQLEAVRSGSHRASQSKKTKAWRMDPERSENWRVKNAAALQSSERRASAKATSKANWNDPEVRKRRTEGLQRAAAARTDEQRKERGRKISEGWARRRALGLRRGSSAPPPPSATTATAASTPACGGT